MPPELNGGSPEVSDDGTEPEGNEPESTNLSLTADQVKASPEYKALAKQNRQLARQKGSWESQLSVARTEAAEARQAAEAERQEALQRQLQERLGEDGIAIYQEIAELSAEDPMAAALRVAELVRSAKGQTPPAPANAAPGAQPTGTEGQPVTGANAQSGTPPPPPSQGLDGGQPLGAATTGEDISQLVSDLEKTYAEVVARNQNPATRNRVTMRDRAKGVIAYIGAAYLSGGARPSTRG